MSIAMLERSLKESGKYEEYLRTKQRVENRVYDGMRAEFDPACIERFASYDDEMPGHVFRYRTEDSFLGRRNLSKLFGFKKGRPARECEAMETFLENFMGGCGHNMTGMEDVERFMAHMCLTVRDLQLLWIECGRRGGSCSDGWWPVVEPHGGKWRLAWFVGGVRKTEWQTYDKQCRLLDGTPVFEQ